jgi:hypothetical protein
LVAGKTQDNSAGTGNTRFVRLLNSIAPTTEKAST